MDGLAAYFRLAFAYQYAADLVQQRCYYLVEKMVSLNVEICLFGIDSKPHELVRQLLVALFCVGMLAAQVVDFAHYLVPEVAKGVFRPVDVESAKLYAAVEIGYRELSVDAAAVVPYRPDEQWEDGGAEL